MYGNSLNAPSSKSGPALRGGKPGRVRRPQPATRPTVSITKAHTRTVHANPIFGRRARTMTG